MENKYQIVITHPDGHTETTECMGVLLVANNGHDAQCNTEVFGVGALGWWRRELIVSALATLTMHCCDEMEDPRICSDLVSELIEIGEEEPHEEV